MQGVDARKLFSDHDESIDGRYKHKSQKSRVGIDPITRKLVGGDGMEREDRHTKQQGKKAIHSTELVNIRGFGSRRGIPEPVILTHMQRARRRTAIKRPKIMGLYLFGMQTGQPSI